LGGMLFREGSGKKRKRKKKGRPEKGIKRTLTLEKKAARVASQKKIDPVAPAREEKKEISREG